MKYTLKIFSAEGELWLLRVLLPHQIKNLMADILCTEGFEAGLWKVEITPYNADTDKEDIGDKYMHFLGKQTPYR